MADAEALFAAHQAGLLRYLSRAVGHGETARDLTQDVFVRVIRSDTLPGADAEQRAWLFRIARNIAIDHHRRRHVRGPENLAVPEPSRAASQDTTLEVADALGQLDALDRDVFLMREVGGLCYDEIAAACDLTAAAVRNRIHRARQQLRQSLGSPIDAQRQRGVRFTGHR